jgi:catalase
MADSGVIALTNASSAETYLSEAAKGRIWDREPKVRTVF